MKGLRFESRGEGNYYKLILHIGDTLVPVSDDIIEVLKQHAGDTPERFLPIFLDQVSYSSYLREMIQTELKEGGDADTQVAALQTFVKNL